MNLLPPAIIRRRRYYSLCLQLAAIQAVIFLLLILSVAVFDLTIRTREAQTIEFDMHLQDERFIESEIAAAALRYHYTREAAQQEITDWLELPFFDIQRLDMIKETLPQGVSLLQLDLEEEGAAMTFLAENLSLSDTHREALIDTGLVSRVRLISATAAYDGSVQYVLALRWQD